MSTLIYVSGVLVALLLGLPYLWWESNRQDTKPEKVQYFKDHLWIILTVALLSWLGLIALVIACLSIFLFIKYNERISDYWDRFVNKLF